jgi:hypothetical protein
MKKTFEIIRFAIISMVIIFCFAPFFALATLGIITLQIKAKNMLFSLYARNRKTEKMILLKA